jgi:hypothetical protein
MATNFQKSVSFSLTILFLVLPFYVLSTPRQAEAQGACIAAAAGWVLGLFGIQMTLTTGATAASTGNAAIAVPVSNIPQNGYSVGNNVGQQAQGAISGVVSWKECVLDPLVWLAKSILIEAITTAIVDWINSGFEGSPVFITDLSGFLMDVADKTAGEFIFESGLGFLCSPFQLDIQIKLIIAWYSKWGTEGSYCKLSDIVTNIDDFLNGDFMDGGWEAFAKLNNYPSGNPQGSFLKAADELSLRIGNMTWKEDTLLSRAFNFLSPRCPDGSGDVCTPGKYVENELNSWTDSPLGQLEVADEVDEIISALFAQLTKMILTDEGGLLGATKSGYTDQIRNAQSLACKARKQDLVDKIKATIASEQAAGRTTYLDQLQDILTQAQAVQCDPLDFNYPSLLGEIENEFVSIQSHINLDETQIACSNQIDDDGDGLIDYPADPGCSSAKDDSEEDGTINTTECSDLADNDGDGLIDLADPSCANDSENDNEGALPPPPEPPGN